MDTLLIYLLLDCKTFIFPNSAYNLMVFSEILTVLLIFKSNKRETIDN